MHVFQYLFSYPLGICMFGVSFLVSKSFFHQISGIFVQELDQTKNMLPFKNQACKQSLPIHLFLKQFSSIPLNVVGFQKFHSHNIKILRIEKQTIMDLCCVLCFFFKQRETCYKANVRLDKKKKLGKLSLAMSINLSITATDF